MHTRTHMHTYTLKTCLWPQYSQSQDFLGTVLNPHLVQFHLMIVHVSILFFNCLLLEQGHCWFMSYFAVFCRAIKSCCFLRMIWSQVWLILFCCRCRGLHHLWNSNSGSQDKQCCSRGGTPTFICCSFCSFFVFCLHIFVLSRCLSMTKSFQFLHFHLDINCCLQKG